MGITAFVFGLISVITFWIPAWNYVALLFGFLAIIFGAVALKNPTKKAFAISGMVLGIIGVSIIIIAMVACAGVFGYGMMNMM